VGRAINPNLKKLLRHHHLVRRGTSNTLGMQILVEGLAMACVRHMYQLAA